MRNHLWWSVVVAIACTGARAAAQTPISEAEALRRLSPDSARVRAIRSAVAVSEAEASGVGRWPNPRVSVDREAVAGVSEVLSTVLQPLPITGRRGLDRQAASRGVDAVRARADDDVRRARADLRLAFAELASAQVRERELSAYRERLQELAAVLQRREAAGDAAGFDRLRAEREVLEVEADVAAAVSDRMRAQAQLAGFFAPETNPTTLVAAAAPVPAIEWPPLDALVAQATRARGDVAALGFDMDSAKFSARAADRRRIPEPEVLAGTKTSTLGGGDVGSVVTVQATIPIFDRGRQERRLAEAREAQAAARLESLRVVISTEIAAWRGQATDRRRAADRYRAAALTVAGEVERIARVSYDAGERGILELLDAYRTAASARVRQATLDAAARRAEIELEYASGWEIP